MKMICQKNFNLRLDLFEFIENKIGYRGDLDFEGRPEGIRNDRNLKMQNKKAELKCSAYIFSY